MKFRVILIVLIMAFIITISASAELNPKSHFYTGGGLCGFFNATEIYPGLTIEAFYSYSLLASRISIDYLELGIVRFFSIAGEIGIAVPEKTDFQWYAGAGAGISPGVAHGLFEDWTKYFCHYFISVSTAFYKRWAGHFGMGFSFTYWIYLDDLWGRGLFVPRITFGWKF